MQIPFRARTFVVGLLAIALSGGCSTGTRPTDPRIAAYGPHPYETIHAGTAIMLVDLLRSVRNGDETSAIQTMEEELDRYSASLLLGPDIEDSERRKLLSVIRYIKRYRSEYPHEPNDRKRSANPMFRSALARATMLREEEIARWEASDRAR